MNIEDIKQIMDAFDPAALLPDLTTMAGKMELICRIAVLIGPIVLLVLGLSYLFLAPKEANYIFGYRCYFGMGSSDAWCFTQRLAGLAWSALGLILTLVMLIATTGYRDKVIVDQVWGAAKCLGWEAGLTLISTLAINFTAVYFFDSKGNPRRQIPQLPKLTELKKLLKFKK